MTNAAAVRPPQQLRPQPAKFGIYQTDSGTLFVPCVDMWRVRDCGGPGKTVQAIADATARTDEEVAAARERRLPRYGGTVSVGLIYSWLAALVAERPWFRGWLLHKDRPPAGVALVSAEDSAACCRALDYVGHCRRAGLLLLTYHRWISTGTIPSLTWMQWLYGRRPAPEGVFIVPPELRRLKHETSDDAICGPRGADISRCLPGLWSKNPKHAAGLAEALEVAGKPGKAHGPTSETWAALDPRVRRSMWAFARAARLFARCTRAGITPAMFHNLCRQAAAVGAEGELADYVNSRGRYALGGTRLSGLVAPNFFLPSEKMLAFRKAAQEAVRGALWLERLTGLPGFDAWFLDWALPHSLGGERHRLQAEKGKGEGPRRGKGGGQGKPASSAASQTTAGRDRADANGRPRVEAQEPEWNVRPRQHPEDPPLRVEVVVRPADAADGTGGRAKRKGGGAPLKYPKSLALALELLDDGKDSDRAIYRKCKEAHGREERLPDDADSFMDNVRRHRGKQPKQPVS